MEGKKGGQKKKTNPKQKANNHRKPEKKVF